MLHRLPTVAALTLVIAASPAQSSWFQLPLPPGGAAIFNRACYSAENPLVLEGGLPFEFRNGTWNAMPLPPNTPSITLPNAYFACCGPRPLVCTNAFTELYEWDGSQWNQLPFPPGVGFAHPSGQETVFLESGRRHLVATAQFGLLHEWDGTAWVPLPMPPGETAVPSPTCNAISGSSDRHTFYLNGGTSLVEWDGTAWLPVPLPPGMADLQAAILPTWPGTLAQPRPGRCGAHLTLRRDPTSIWIRRRGTWEIQAAPPGIPDITFKIWNSGRSMVLVWNNQELWGLPTPVRDEWSELPLPPGVTADAQDTLTFGASRPLALTNGGANLWELRGTTWTALPLPAGTASIGQSTFSGMLPGGRNPLVATNFYQDLAEWNGASWNAIPLPPGAPYIGGFSGCDIHDCGARPLATTVYGHLLHEWTGSQWSPLPLPVGVNQVHPIAGVLAVPGTGDRHTLSTGYGTGLVEWDGAQWQSIPLPAGVVDIGGDTELQPRPDNPFTATVGRAGGHLTLTLDHGATMLQWIDGQWQELRFPEGVTATQGSGSTIGRGSRSHMLVATDGGTRLWARANRFQDVEATSACAGTATVDVVGTPVLGGSLTLSIGAPAPTWITGFAVDGPMTLPSCNCPILANAVWVYGAYTLAIPADANFLGIELYAQGVDFVPGPTTCDLPPPAALTDVLRIVIG